MTKREKIRLKRLAKLSMQLRRNSSEPHLCRLSSEQLHYICHRLGMSCFVEACPGGGKTEVVGMKAAFELAGWCQRSAGIAILAFTRNAAKVIRERVARYAGEDRAQHPHFIGTIDSWIHGYLLHPFGHAITGYAGTDGDKSVRIIEAESRAPFLNTYRVTTAEGKVIPANRYYKRYNGSLEGAPRTNIDHFDYDRLMETKNRFLKGGFATYEDAEYICFQVLKRYSCIANLLSKRFPYIIIDECQDLSYSQLCIFYKLVEAGAAVHLIGDPKQAIYEFRKVNPEDLLRFVGRLRLHRRSLTRNFRSNQEIIDTFGRLIAGSPRIRGEQPTTCTPPCRLWQYTSETITDLPGHFAALVADFQLDKNRSCVLVRGTSLLSQLHPRRGSPRSPTELFATALAAWNETHRSTAAIESALQNTGKCLSLLGYAGRGYHQHQHCPDQFRPHEWRQLLATILNNAHELYPFVAGQTWSSWARDLKQYLHGVWDSLQDTATEAAAALRRIRAPQGKSRDEVAAAMHPTTPSHGLRVTTIHDVKGETFDAVLLISAQNKLSPGGHIDHWLHPSPDNEEYRRFAYVACSRPQHLLVLATPQLEVQQVDEIRGLGFAPEQLPLGPV